MPRRRQESDNGSDAGQEGCTFETMRDEGEHFVHVKQFDKAIESFTKALELRADDKNCLVTRSKCYLQLGNADLSLQDAEKALELDEAEKMKKSIRALYQKGEALYHLGDFEQSLMFFHRGHKQRPELQEFRLGIQKCQEAIENSIGTPESVKLEAKGDLSYFYKQQEAKKQQRGGYQKPMVKKEEKKEREHTKGTADKKTVKQLLGEMYGDKEYLEKLLNDGSLTAKRSDLKEPICDGLDYLHRRIEFWQKQKPMYARKRDKLRSQRQPQRRQPKEPMEKVLKNLEEIEDAQNEGRYQDCLEKAKSTLKLVETASDEDIQNKPELIGNLYSSIGNAYLEMGKVNQALDYHEKDLDLSTDHGLEDGKSRALDNLGRVYARKGDYEKAIEVWQKKIPASKSALESTWLFHEIGRCYLELGKYSEARDYGEKSLGAAKDADDDGWCLHARVLTAQAEVKLCDYQAAADSFEKALEMAKSQNDVPAQDAIQKALNEVNAKIVQGVKDGDDRDDEEQPKGDADNYDDDFEEEKDEEKPKVEDKPAPPPPKPRTPTPPPKARTPTPPPKPRTPTPPPPPPKEKTPEPETPPKSPSIKEEAPKAGSTLKSRESTTVTILSKKVSDLDIEAKGAETDPSGVAEQAAAHDTKGAEPAQESSRTRDQQVEVEKETTTKRDDEKKGATDDDVDDEKPAEKRSVAGSDDEGAKKG